MQLTIRLASRPTWRVLVVATAVLVAGHVVGMVLENGVGYDVHLLRILDLNEELGFGTVYSVLLLGVCALVLAIITVAARRRGAAEQRDAPWWAGLTLLFVFMAADEGAEIHEVLIEPLRATLNTSGVFYYAWVVPYAAFAVVVGVTYIRFLLRLPRGIAIRMTIAGVVYVGGAVGLELLAGWMVATRGYGPRSFPMELEYLVEETMEMLGAAYFLLALLEYVELGGAPLALSASLPDTTGTTSQ